MIRYFNVLSWTIEEGLLYLKKVLKSTSKS
jgi:hypothetical protein